VSTFSLITSDLIALSNVLDGGGGPFSKTILQNDVSEISDFTPKIAKNLNLFVSPSHTPFQNSWIRNLPSITSHKTSKYPDKRLDLPQSALYYVNTDS
jgi:hypothetical protein